MHLEVNEIMVKGDWYIAVPFDPAVHSCEDCVFMHDGYQCEEMLCHAEGRSDRRNVIFVKESVDNELYFAKC